LFKRDGRGLVLTEAGQVLMGYARRLLALNDEAASALGTGAAGGTVRLGMPQDFADILLPKLLQRVGKAQPDIQVEIKAGRSYALAEEVEHGRLDVALSFAEPRKGQRQRVAKLGRVWVGPADRTKKTSTARPVPLVLFDVPCLFRQKGIEALDRAGIPWRLSLTTPSLLAGVWSCVRAGLGITVRTRVGMPLHVAILGSRAGLPKLPAVDLLLLSTREPSSRVRLLTGILREMIASECLDDAIE
jgi:DNA-binding transcriptional LysR family regulator